MRPAHEAAGKWEEATSVQQDRSAPGGLWRNGRYDHGKRRRAQRHGREKGCWVYIAAEQLERTGFVPGGELPYYRTWGSPRGSVTARLYREGD